MAAALPAFIADLALGAAPPFRAHHAARATPAPPAPAPASTPALAGAGVPRTTCRTSRGPGLLSIHAAIHPAPRRQALAYAPPSASPVPAARRPRVTVSLTALPIRRLLADLAVRPAEPLSALLDNLQAFSGLPMAAITASLPYHTTPLRAITPVDVLLTHVAFFAAPSLGAFLLGIHAAIHPAPRRQALAYAPPSASPVPAARRPARV
jgi:hypothetical protein